jgi:hypothetical protein
MEPLKKQRPLLFLLLDLLMGDIMNTKMKQRALSLHRCIHCIGVKQADSAVCTYDKIN